MLRCTPRSSYIHTDIEREATALVHGDWRMVHSAIETADYRAHKDAQEDRMNEEEEEALGKLAYETYLTSYYLPGVTDVRWEDQPETHRKHWIAAANAVAARVLQEVQASVEASE